MNRVVGGDDLERRRGRERGGGTCGATEHSGGAEHWGSDEVSAGTGLARVCVCEIERKLC